MVEVFKLIYDLRNIEDQELIIDEDDEYFLRASYRKVEKIISYKLWKKIVIDFSIDTLQDIYTSCDILMDEVYKKYGKK